MESLIPHEHVHDTLTTHRSSASSPSYSLSVAAFINLYTFDYHPII